MPALAVHVAMRDFFQGGGAYFGHGAGKIQLQPGERMIAVNYYLVLRNAGNSVNIASSEPSASPSNCMPTLTFSGNMWLRSTRANSASWLAGIGAYTLYIEPGSL